MVTGFRLRAPTPAILDKPGGEYILVALPADTVLEQEQPFQFSTTLLGMVSLYWEGRYYSIHLKDLKRKAERVSTGRL
jgi:hypothetical protein